MPSAEAKLLELLTDGTLEQRAAAAIVIGELAPKQAAIVSALADAAGPGERSLRLKSVEALGKIASGPARDALYPLLDDPEVRESAAQALARTGNPVVTYVRKAFPTTPHLKRRTLVQILSLVRTKDAMKVLLSILEDPHGPTVSDAVEIFKQETTALDDRSRRTLSVLVREALDQKDFRRNRNALEAALELLNHLHDPGSASVVLEFATPENPPELRRMALSGLRWMLPGYQDCDKAAVQLLAYLEEDDFPHVVSPALEALMSIDVPKSSASTLIELGESLHPLVRKFALTKMSAMDHPGTTRSLAAALSDGDPMVRQLAARSIAEQAGAWKVILEELRACKSVDTGWRMVRAVRAGSEAVSREELVKLGKEATDRLEQSDGMAEPMISLLQTIGPAVHFEVLHKRAQYWKRKKDFAKAQRCLDYITECEEFDDDHRFELAMVALRNGSARSAAVTRESDLPLTLVRALIKGGTYPVMKKITAESRTLESADLYYLGFHLVEGQMVEREIGTSVLQRLVEKTPRSKAGKSAKTKLKLEGLLE